jgi:hypothetical protein
MTQSRILPASIAPHFTGAIAHFVLLSICYLENPEDYKNLQLY